MPHPNEGGTAPEVETPPAETPAAAPPPPNAGPDAAALQAQLAQMAEQNQKLVSFIEQMGQERAAGAPPPPAPKELEVDPDVQEWVKQTMAPVQQQNQQLQDQLDRLHFWNQVQASGADPKMAADAEALYANWQQTGFYTVNAKGQRRIPGRLDALRMVAGDAAIQAQAKGAPERTAAQLRNMLGVERPSGTVGRGFVAPVDDAAFEALPLDERLKKRAEALDATGF